jgi:broad specificity phosphatase PhoE
VPSIAVRIVYETHATTTDNEAGVATGWLPGELSGTGHRQALELGARRRDDGIDVAFVSDLGRATETAKIALADTLIAVVQDARLRECNYGSLNGTPAPREHAERLRHVTDPFPDGESYQDVVTRMSDFLRDLSRDWDGRRVLLISHSAPRLALDCLLEGASLVELVAAPFEWQPGWEYVVPSGWDGVMHS